MQQGSYTELFFLDEVTALAAGHRPCYECRRDDAEEFASAAQAQLGRSQSFRAGDLDTEIQKDIKPFIRKFRQETRGSIDPRELPDGAMYGQNGKAYLKVGRHGHAWTFGGYGSPEPLPAAAQRLTPRFTCAALAGGYIPQIDASAPRA